MKKKIKKYISGSMVALLLVASIPSQIVAETDTGKASSNADKISEDISKEPTDTDQTMLDVQDDINVSESDEMNENARITDNSDTDDVTYAFTDPGFQKFVRKILGLNHSELITKSACANVESLVIEYDTAFSLGIKNVNGFEHFKNLKYLDCSEVYIESLNVENFTDLQTLKCCVSKQLNISGCPALESLDLEDSEINKLDISGCPALESLDLEDSEINKLDISGCPALEIFGFGMSGDEHQRMFCLGIFEF